MQKVDPDRSSPKTQTIPVTTMVEVPVLDEAARAEMLASLREAEADIAAGRARTFTADAFVDWLAGRGLAARRAKTKAHGL